MKPYDVIKSDKVFRGRILDVVHETVVLPDEREAVREIVVRGPAAAVVAVEDDGRILFVRQYRSPFHELVLELPAGMMNDAEDPMICAERELTEETGMIAGKISHMLSLRTTVGFCDEVIHIYLAQELKAGRQHLDDDEFIEIEKYTLDEAVSMIISGKIADAKTVAGIFAYKEIKERNGIH